jgi:DNA-binding NarL/FixJ family response regulator
VCTALIVEENPAFRLSMKQMLHMRFPLILVDEAENGDEAVRKISASSPDMIFMNIKLSAGNGLDITRRIKDLNADAVIVMLTSHDLPEYREAAYRSGASHFFAKDSSNCEEIVTLVESMMLAKGKSCS